MRNTVITSTVGEATLQYPDTVAFMYSRQPVIIELPKAPAGDARITIQCIRTGQTYTETRAFYSGRVEFDISRIMQLTAPDVDEVTKGVGGPVGQSLSVKFNVIIESDLFVDGSTSFTTYGMYGALDQDESYGEPEERRLWVNFPQTFNLWKDQRNDVAFTFTDSGISVTPETSADILGRGSCWECEFNSTAQAQAPEDYARLINRHTDLLFLTRRYLLKDGQETSPLGSRYIMLTIDKSRPEDGEFLRWLNRRGEMSYWLFTRSNMSIKTALTDNFIRYYAGNPAAPVDGQYVNPHKGAYSEAREMVLGATRLSLGEYEYLSDLASSPVVERLLIRDGENRWQRVNVAAGTLERNVKRLTPNLQDLEFVIELPERNTIQL
jgi:hypothetical protein